MKIVSFLFVAALIISPPWPAAAQTNQPVTQETQDRIDRFIRRMTYWGEYYSELAGSENLGLSYDDQVKQEGLLIEGGDWAVFDRRLCSGAYGVSHEDGSIFPVELTNPKDHDTSCISPAITSQVDAIELMQRYQWFHALFINWSHVLTPYPFSAGSWDGFVDAETSYGREKSDLADDPHLALYWLMHFGFTLDERYGEVRQLISENDLAERLSFIDDAVAFFDHQSPYDDIAISNSYADDAEFEDIFLKRRAYLVYVSRSLSYASGSDGLEAWWASIALYPKAERYMIQRMRWLGNNLSKFDQWQAFNELLEQVSKPDDISLLSYVRALNPFESSADRERYASVFLNELIANEQLWKNPVERRFGQAMIWQVRESATDKTLLRTATDLYFADDTISEFYEDLNGILNGEAANQNLAAIREAVETLTNAAERFDRYNATPAERAAFFQVIDETLDRANTGGFLFEVVANLDREALQERALRYVYTRDVSRKAELFTDLYIRLEPGSYDMPDIFEGMFPQMFEDENDPNIKLARQLLFLPDADYRNDYVAEKGREAATMFFLDSMHWPANFEFFMDILKDPAFNDSAGLKESIFSNLLSREYDTEINPTHRMNQAQLKYMLETISDMLRERDWLEYRFTQEAVRTIYYLDNPLAKNWMEARYNNEEWLRTFPNRDMGFDPLRVEINDAVGSSLEFMAEIAAE